MGFLFRISFLFQCAPSVLVLPLSCFGAFGVLLVLCDGYTCTSLSFSYESHFVTAWVRVKG
jgi:hypothetical protein